MGLRAPTLLSSSSSRPLSIREASSRFIHAQSVNQALAATDKTALPALSTVGWFFPLPWLGYDAGNVALPACHLALAAARAPPVAMYEDAQNDNKLATIASEPGVVGSAGLWPRCDAPALLPHDGRSDSPCAGYLAYLF